MMESLGHKKPGRCPLVRMMVIAMSILLLTIQPGVSIQAFISPVNPIMEVGSNLTLTCNLTAGLYPAGLTAHDVVWYKNRTLIPIEEYHVDTNETSTITLFDVAVSDSSTYYCAFAWEQNITDFEETVVLVGLLPKPVNLTCTSHNIVNFYCEWAAEETHIPTTHTYQAYSRRKWINCYRRTQPNRCDVQTEIDDYATNWMKVRINSSNALGQTTKVIYFRPDLETTPLPVTTVQVTAIDSSSLRVNWMLPPTWQDTYERILSYKISYASEYEPTDWLEPDENIESKRDYTIGSLEAFTNYSVKISAKYDYNSYWTPWSDPVFGKTGESRPNGKVQNLKTFDNVSDAYGGIYKRDVTIVWDALRERNRRGVILGYNVAVHAGPQCLPQDSITISVNRTQAVIQGLEKFCSYRVIVCAYNSIGTSPEEEEQIADMTHNPLPPYNVSAKALSHQSVQVRWTSTQLDGHILNYAVHWWNSNGQKLKESKNIPANVTSVVIEGLKEYVFYNIRVSKTNKLGTSSLSAIAQVRTLEWYPAAAPTNVIARQTEDASSLEISWTNVADVDTNGFILGHVVYYCLYSGAALDIGSLDQIHDGYDVQEENFTGAEKNPVILSNLQPFTSYIIWVSAYNSIGKGPTSNYTIKRTTIEEPLSRLIWLTLPAGTILLFALVTSLYYIQTRLGKSWPDPIFTDIVKNGQDALHIPKRNAAEKEEFNTIRQATSHGGPCENVYVYGKEVEEYPAGAFHVPSLTLHHISREDVGFGGKGRTISVDSGIPTSPQDQTISSDSDDAFHPAEFTTLPTNSYYCTTDTKGSPAIKIMGLGKGGKPKRSVSSSGNSEAGDPLLAISENGALDSLAVKYAISAYVDDLPAPSSPSGYKVASSASVNENGNDYSSDSQLPTSSQKGQHPCPSQAVRIVNHHGDRNEGGNPVCLSNNVAQSVCHDNNNPILRTSSSTPMSASGYVSHNEAYSKMGVHGSDACQETSLEARSGNRDEDNGVIDYTVLAIPQRVPEKRENFTSGDSALTYVTAGESLTYSKVATSPVLPVHVQPTQTGEFLTSPYVSNEGLQHLLTSPRARERGRQGEMPASSCESPSCPAGSPSKFSSDFDDFTNHLADYVQGADLAISPTSSSSSSLEENAPLRSPHYVMGKVSFVYPNSDQIPLSSLTHCQLQAGIHGRVGRARTESTASSGYVSDTYVKSKPKLVSQYASLVFSSSESMADSNPDDEVHKADIISSGSPETSLNAAGKEGHASLNTSFVEYVKSFPSSEDLLSTDLGDGLSLAVTEDGPMISFSDNIIYSTPLGRQESKQEPGDTMRDHAVDAPYVAWDADVLTKGLRNERPTEGLPNNGPAKYLPNDCPGTCYQVPRSIACAVLPQNEGDDGYVPYSGDSGYVPNTPSTNQKAHRDEYLPMFAITK